MQWGGIERHGMGWDGMGWELQISISFGYHQRQHIFQRFLLPFPHRHHISTRPRYHKSNEKKIGVEKKKKRRREEKER